MIATAIIPSELPEGSGAGRGRTEGFAALSLDPPSVRRVILPLLTDHKASALDGSHNLLDVPLDQPLVEQKLRNQ